MEQGPLGIPVALNSLFKELLMTVRFLAPLALLFAGSLFLTAVHGDDKQDAKRDGTWVAVSMEQEGKKLPDALVKKLTIKLITMGDTYKVTFNDKVAEEGSSKADWTRKPTAVDIDASKGPNKGKTIQAILSIEGDTMKVCYNLKGESRPTEFATKEGSGHTLIVYEREKK